MPACPKCHSMQVGTWGMGTFHCENCGNNFEFTPEYKVHTDVHECNHSDCECFWCRVSRKEKFETLTETQSL